MVMPDGDIQDRIWQDPPFEIRVPVYSTPVNGWYSPEPIEIDPSFSIKYAVLRPDFAASMATGLPVYS